MVDKSISEVLHDPKRLEVIDELNLVSPAEKTDFDNIAALAAQSMDTPVGLVTLLREDKQQFLGTFGTELTETPVEDAFCVHTIAADGEGPLLVLDALNDIRFQQNKLVLNAPGVRFYAGVPVFVDGQKIGSVCTIDVEPRSAPGASQLRALQKLAKIAATLIRLNDSSRRSRESDLARRRAEFRHSLALRAAAISAWMWNIKANLVTADDTLPDWVDLDMSKPLSMQQLMSIVHPDDMEDVRVALDMTLTENIDFHCEFRIFNSDRWLMGQGRVYERSSDGQALSMAGVFVDITATKQSEQTTRLLLRELNHRVKNTLAMLQSLAAQTLKYSTSSEAFMRAFSGRLQALSAAHTMLSDNQWHRVSIHGLLKTLITPYAPRYDDNVRIAGDDVLIGPDEGLGLGLVIHEFATNAARHGALSVQSGKVNVETRLHGQGEDRRLHIHWTETDGPEVPETRDKGFGSVLIERGLQKVLGSKVETRFDPQGVTASISFPLSAAEIH